MIRINYNFEIKKYTLLKFDFFIKNNKLLYYLLNYSRQLVPAYFYRKKLNSLLSKKGNFDQDMLERRLNYYNKLDAPTDLKDNPTYIRDLKIPKRSKVYYFDFYEYARYFKDSFKGHFLYGDVTVVPNEPSFVKSRPVSDANANSVLLKWNKVRHFNFVNDNLAFEKKLDKLVWRGDVHNPQKKRIAFLEKYHSHFICNIGHININSSLNPAWKVDKMSIPEQLNYKFILSIEGNDVASNLKWIMSSNSIAVMPKPKYETWFMEGLLVADFHYIEIKDDFSDLEEKLNYYIENPDKAESILKNAHKFVNQFKNLDLENILSLLVIQKYFKVTNQL